VQRTSVEAVGKDPAALSEAVVGEDPAALGKAPAVNPPVVTEEVSKAPTVDSMAVGKAIAVQAWRRSRSEHTGGGEMIVAKVRV
jgi:hypothetical protein